MNMHTQLTCNDVGVILLPIFPTKKILKKDTDVDLQRYLKREPLIKVIIKGIDDVFDKNILT